MRVMVVRLVTVSVGARGGPGGPECSVFLIVRMLLQYAITRVTFYSEQAEVDTSTSGSLL